MQDDIERAIAARNPAQLLLPAFVGAPERNRIYNVDALTFLKALPDASVDCVVTSPPYWGLRDYGVGGQIGLEDTIEAYVVALVAIFREVRRALRDEGSCWLNLGDSYSSGGRSLQVFDTLRSGQVGTDTRPPNDNSIKPKDLCGIPWRVALALQADGWYLRSDIIWHKPNPMPESVTDRPTGAHEYVFLLTKSARYWYDHYAIREESINAGKEIALGEKSFSKRQADGAGVARSGNALKDSYTVGAGRNARSVWTIATQPTKEAHFATFPQALVERCVKAGAPPTVCALCGKAHVRVVEREEVEVDNWSPANGKSKDQGDQFSYKRIRGNVERYRAAGRDHDNPFPKQINLGFIPQCDHDAATKPGLVLDPFMGSGTTALVARRLGRDFIGCDLNADYVALARKRVREADPFQDSEVAPGIEQLSLFKAG